MTRRKEVGEHTDGEGSKETTRQKRRPRAPRVKPLSRSMQDPRHDPDAAIAAIKAAFQAGGTAVNEAEFNERRNNGYVKQIPTGKIIATRDGQIRYRSPEVKTGPGQTRSPAERMIVKAETAFARKVNEITKVSAFEAGKTRASQIAAGARTRAAVLIAARVCELFEASALVPHSRAAAIAKTMNREGHVISARRVREILARRRKN